MSISSVNAASLYSSPFQRLSIGLQNNQGGRQVNPLDQLKKIDSKLADKIQSFKDQAEKLQKSGASSDLIHQTMSNGFKTLTADQKSELKSVFGARGSRVKAPTIGADGANPPSGGPIFGAKAPNTGPAPIFGAHAPNTGPSLLSLLASHPLQNPTLAGLLKAQSDKSARDSDSDANGQ